MGIFSSKKKEGGANTIPMSPGGSGIPRPPTARHSDDFDKPFGIDRPVYEQMGGGGTIALTPTMLSPSQPVDLGLPSFRPDRRNEVDIDQIERELSINSPKAAPKESAPLEKAAETEAKFALDEEKVPQMNAPEEDELSLESDIGEEIPDTIEDIPDFIPELDVGDELFHEAMEAIDEPKDSRAIFIGMDSISRIKESSNEIKARVDSVAESIRAISDNYRKERELILRSKSGYEDIERKILFVNRIMFSEE